MFLRMLIAGPAEPQEIWMLRPDTLEPVRLRGVNRGVETIALAGRSVAARQVEIRPGGMAGLVWRARYWFRESDGLFLCFEAPTRLPGSPMTVVELAD